MFPGMGVFPSWRLLYRSQRWRCGEDLCSEIIVVRRVHWVEQNPWQLKCCRGEDSHVSCAKSCEPGSNLVRDEPRGFAKSNGLEHTANKTVRATPEGSRTSRSSTSHTSPISVYASTHSLTINAIVYDVLAVDFQPQTPLRLYLASQLFAS